MPLPFPPSPELIEYFKSQMKEDPDVASAVAAIRTLLEFLKRDRGPGAAAGGGAAGDAAPPASVAREPAEAPDRSPPTNGPPSTRTIWTTAGAEFGPAMKTVLMKAMSQCLPRPRSSGARAGLGAEAWAQLPAPGLSLTPPLMAVGAWGRAGR